MPSALLRGFEVATLAHDIGPTAVYTVRVEHGGVASGVHINRLETSRVTETRRLMVARWFA